MIVVTLYYRAPQGALLGGDLLRRFDVDLNFAERTVSFYQWRNCPSGKPNWTAQYVAVALLPGSSGGNIVVVPGLLDDKACERDA